MGITFGSSSAPSQITVNFDAVFTTSLANIRKKLHDNIGAANAFLFEMMKSDFYKSVDGGTDIRVPLMYDLTPADSYSGYDELPATVVDGVTEAVYQWAQAAVPVSYNMKEVKQNKQKVLALIETKLKQSNMGFQEYFARSIMWGAAADGGNLYDPRTSPANGSNSINPLPLLIKFDPTTATSLGNIDPSSAANAWWRNVTKTAASTTYLNFMMEFNNIFNTCALGTGGKPKIVLMDQVSYENLVQAYWVKYQQQPQTDANYPFENTMFKGAHIIMDDKVPDVYTGTTSAATYGSAFFINTEFLEVNYEEGTDFELLRDDAGKAFQKPTNGDSRLAHIAWMGQSTVSNRRKQGVLGKIARATLT